MGHQWAPGLGPPSTSDGSADHPHHHQNDSPAVVDVLSSSLGQKQHTVDVVLAQGHRGSTEVLRVLTCHSTMIKVQGKAKEEGMLTSTS